MPKKMMLFYDEADSILGKRLSNVSQSTDHAVNVSRSVMLLELDSFKGVTLFATNFMSNYDSAFVRRIIGHIEMPLPTEDFKCCHQCGYICIKQRGHSLSSQAAGF